MNKSELNDIIEEEKGIYIKKNYSFQKFTHSKRYMIWRFLSYYRLTQFYREEQNKCSGIQKIITKVKLRYFTRKKNIYSEKCGIEISNGVRIGRRLRLWHGGVVINAHLGDDCLIHGNNVLGNKGVYPFDQLPTLGNYVDVGVGAVIIGKIEIADDCRIGANAVVTKSFTTPGSVIVGIPGRLLEKG